MKINRIETTAYMISAEAEDSAVKHFRAKAVHFEKEYGTKVTAALAYFYTPLVVLSAVKYDKDGKGILLQGLQNEFHVGLADGGMYFFAPTSRGPSAKEALIKPSVLDIKCVDFLLTITTLSPKALKTLGYLLDQGTIPFDKLDVPSQTAAKELTGRKLADIYRPVDRESDLTTAFRDVVEFYPVTPIYKVKPIIPIPRFSHTEYDLSAKLKTIDVVEDDFTLLRVAHAPEKLMYLIGTLFNCALHLKRIVYMPCIQCTYQWAGNQMAETRYIACTEYANPRKYGKPKRLKTITIGTKNHGLEAIPFEDTAINFTDVAGMAQVKEKIKEAIIYPITNMQLSQEYGSKAGGGVLFYGPPGCGKTYIMKATVGEAGVDFFSVAVQEVVGDDVESASKRMDETFAEARENAPSILFFDEIDALGGSRQTSMTGAERRLVNQFLTNLEGVGAANRDVLVVGSTNAPWYMDPALRRAGRFTTQIFIPPPDYEARLALFKVHLKGRPLSEDLKVERLAELTENYASADITAICDEAAKIPWRESVRGLAKRPIAMDDFLTVLNERDSSLTAWLRMAEKQLRDSGEADIFPDLADYIFKRAGGIEMVSQPKLNFADVGGLEDVKEEIRSKIVYPMKNPELSRNYGRKVSGGVLLYGPPGCGKTYVAKATAGECGASFFNVKITDLLSPEEGVTEKRLHSIFDRASRNAPAIVFFDEIDAIAGHRSSADKGVERRLINQFLTEMDGFDKTEGVVILAATNAPWDIDPALRRAGRFSDQIFLPPPDAKSREEIFGIHLKMLPAGPDVTLPELSNITEGYSSADIKLICDEAAKIPWKEGMKGGSSRLITMADFRQVLRQRQPSITPWIKQAEKQVRESGEDEVYGELSEYLFKRAGGLDAVSKPTMNFSQVGGLEQVKEEIRNKIVYPMRDPALAREYGRAITGGILMYGPPGCGKTYIAKATAGECGASFFNVRMTDLLSPTEGESEKKLHSIFERASRNPPSVVFFDEIDAIAGYRSSAAAGVQRRLVNQFLTEMDGFEKKEGVVVLAATNAPWDIDPALRRAGRFSDQIFIPPPDAKSRAEVFRIHMGALPVAADVDLAELSALTDGYSSADIKLVCDEAAKIPWAETMRTGQRRPISAADFKAVISGRRSSILPWFSQAGKELRARGEEAVYPELAESARKFAPAPARDSAEPALEESRKVQELMDMAKERFRRGEMDEETLRSLLLDYEKRRLQLEAELSLKGKGGQPAQRPPG
jgi:SpoVK/Ycf46/Vps4 family AAA+-type ATPase